MRWKTWILVFAIFASVCIVADLMFTYVFIYPNPGCDSARIRHLYNDNSDDIPIFGTSKAHGHYSPEDMGINAFNYGMDAASYEITDVFLQIELAKSRTTPIIIELQHNDTGKLGEQSRFIPFAWDPRFRALLRKFHATSWRYYVPGIRYFGYYDLILRNYMDERWQIGRTSHGFNELVHSPPFNKAQLAQYVRERLSVRNGFFPDEDQNSRLLAHITEHPQRLFILVISPYHPSYYSNFENEDQLAAFESKLAAMPNVVLLDWGKQHFDEEYYLDTLHLRREGTAIFSRRLGEKIRQILQERKIQSSSVKTAETK